MFFFKKNRLMVLTKEIACICLLKFPPIPQMPSNCLFFYRRFLFTNRSFYGGAKKTRLRIFVWSSLQFRKYLAISFWKCVCFGQKTEIICVSSALRFPPMMQLPPRFLFFEYIHFVFVRNQNHKHIFCWRFPLWLQTCSWTISGFFSIHKYIFAWHRHEKSPADFRPICFSNAVP